MEKWYRVLIKKYADIRDDMEYVVKEWYEELSILLGFEFCNFGTSYCSFGGTKSADGSLEGLGRGRRVGLNEVGNFSCWLSSSVSTSDQHESKKGCE